MRHYRIAKAPPESVRGWRQEQLGTRQPFLDAELQTSLECTYRDRWTRYHSDSIVLLGSAFSIESISPQLPLSSPEGRILPAKIKRLAQRLVNARHTPFHIGF